MSIRTKTTMIILSTLVIGMILGALITGAVIHRRVMFYSDLTMADRFVHVFERLIGPEESNRDTVHAILRDHSRRFSEINRTHHLLLAEIVDSLMVELDPVLTESQKGRLEKRLDYIRKLVKEPDERNRHIR